MESEESRFCQLILRHVIDCVWGSALLRLSQPPLRLPLGSDVSTVLRSACSQSHSFVRIDSMESLR